jgi:phosphoribosyl 1,2-cyclic phosphodiesterase
MLTRKVRILASGSSGNSIFVRLGETRILVDAGISYTRIKKRLAAIDESVDELSAVVVTHEHSDHVTGLKQLFKKQPELPLLATRGTLRALKVRGVDTRRLKPGTPMRWSTIDVVGFNVSHDAEEPIGVRIETGDFAMAVCTDLGFWTDEVAEALTGCPFVVAEANHDLQMLRAGPYPQFLKRRVSGRYGHLSNAQLRALLDRIAGPGLETVVLSHLSDTNNTSEHAYAAAHKALGDDVELIVAQPGEAGQVLEPTGTARFAGPPRQLGLF